jgi:hypothetical protein
VSCAAARAARVAREMFFTILGALIVDCALLGVLLLVVAPHNAARDLFHLLLVATGTTIGALVIHTVLTPHIGLFSFLVLGVLCAVLLIAVTGTNPKQAAIIATIFFAVKLGVNLALAYVFSNT